MRLDGPIEKLGLYRFGNAEFEAGKVNKKTVGKNTFIAVHLFLFYEWDILPDPCAAGGITVVGNEKGEITQLGKATAINRPDFEVDNSLVRYFELAQPAGKATKRVISVDAPGHFALLKNLLGIQDPYDMNFTITLNYKLKNIANSNVTGTFRLTIDKTGKAQTWFNGNAIQ